MQVLTPLMVSEWTYEDCWGLVRPSNTTPCLVLRFEGKDDTELNNIQERFKKWLERSGIPAENL